MKYKKIKKGIFQDRPNRFIAHVWVDGKLETVHIKNTGRCKELLVPGAVLYVQCIDGLLGGVLDVGDASGTAHTGDIVAEFFHER